MNITTMTTWRAGPILGRIWFLLVVAVSILAPRQVHAVEYKIYSPLVVRGETEAEFRGFYSADNASARDGEQGYRLAFGHAFTDNWASELYGVFGASPGGSLRGESVEWENHFQLTPQGKYWLDTGIMTELSVSTQGGEPSEVALIPLLENQTGRIVTTLNPFLEWQFGSNAESGTTFGYRGRVEYLWHPAISPAVEFHGEPGEIGDFGHLAGQRHQAGPAIYGVDRLGGRRAFLYSTALLFGLTWDSPDTTMALRLEYEF
jgi:hypothetical protein